LLRSLDPPPWHLRHASAVADVAAWLARAIHGQGHRLDVALVEAAALLHDVDKALPAAHPARRLRHGDGSAAWLTALGHPELAAAVRDHPVTRLASDEEAALVAASPLEARIVAYADKRAGQRLEPMDVRFASWRHRYPEGPADPVSGLRSGWDDPLAARVRERAAALELDVCAAAGVAPGDVRRLRWSVRALAEASAAGGAAIAS